MHYGVLGMRWGVRKDRSRGRTGNRKKNYNKGRSKRQNDEKNKRQYTPKQIKTKKKALKDPVLLRKNMDLFTTKELDDAIKRIEFDYKLQDLSFKKVNKGKKYVDTVIGYGKTGKDIYDLYNSKAGKAARKRVSAAISKRR